ncbi:MAG: acyltransferase [Actinomycetota bacterium]
MAAADTVDETAGPPRSGRLGYLPGLDGLRAVAVGAVFVHHAEQLDGGFLGVDVFFVISGFLITALAIGEVEQTGRLNLWSFWARRARRLLPAVFALCAAVVVWSAFDGAATVDVRREVVATLLYIANWDRLREGYEYFAAYEDPSLLEHTWSLAIEEQFYVVWPVLLVAAVWTSRRIGGSPRTVVAVGAMGIAVASAAWSWWSAADGADLNRLYFGTDTRAVGLALGSVAGCVLARGAATGERRVGAFATTAGFAGTAVLGWLMLVADGTDRWLYQWGFPVAAVASLAVIVAALGAGPIRSILAVGPLVAIGKVSYGVYLWHWPVIIVLDEDRTGLDGWALGLIWVAVTAALTVASWVLVERRAPLPTREIPARAISYAGTAVAVAVAAFVLAPAETEPVELVLPSATTSTTIAPTTVPSADDAETTTTTTTEPPPPDRPVRMLILGDSIAESLGEPLLDTFEVGPLEVEVTNRSVIACPVTWEGNWAFTDGRLVDDPSACDGDDRFAADLDEVDPDLVFLLFGWSGGLADRRFDDGSTAGPCDEPFDRRYAADYQALIDRIGTDAAVVIATVAPPTSFRFDDQRDRPACLNELIGELEAPTFDFGEWLCPGTDCSAAEPLLRDPVHFAATPEVRELVWPAIVDEVVSTLGVEETRALVADR